jgi:hypothetical protein
MATVTRFYQVYEGYLDDENQQRESYNSTWLVMDNAIERADEIATENAYPDGTVEVETDADGSMTYFTEAIEAVPKAVAIIYVREFSDEADA